MACSEIYHKLLFSENRQLQKILSFSLSFTKMHYLNKLGIEWEAVRGLSQWKRVNYRAVISWLADCKVGARPESNNARSDLIKKYVEASYHLREIKDWERASMLLKIPLCNGQEFHEQLGTWGNYLEQVELYLPLVGKYDAGLDSLCLNGLGGLHLEQGHYKKAVGYYKKLLVKAKENSQVVDKIRALGGLGKAYLNSGEIALATKFYEQQLEVSQASRDKKGECLACLGSANISAFTADFPEATSQYLRAMIRVISF